MKLEKAVFKIYQDSQKNTSARASFLMKLQVEGLQLYLKRLQPNPFPMNIAQFLRKPISCSSCKWFYPQPGARYHKNYEWFA